MHDDTFPSVRDHALPMAWATIGDTDFASPRRRWPG